MTGGFNLGIAPQALLTHQKTPNAAAPRRLTSSMSALGQKQTFCDYPQNVRFRGKAGGNYGLAEGLLITKSGHKRHFRTTILAQYDAVGWEPSMASEAVIP